MSRPIRILTVINELLFGGDENRLLNFAREVDRDRFDLTIATLKRPNPVFESRYGTMRGQFARAGIEVIDLGIGHGIRGLHPMSAVRLRRAAGMFVSSVLRVCALAKNRKIDVIDAHGGPGQLVGVTAGVILRKPRMVTTYAIEQWEPRWLYRPVHAWTMKTADSIVTDSEPVAAALRVFASRPGAAVTVIPNGVVPPRAVRPAAEIRAELCIPSDPVVRVVGQISAFFPFKGHKVLLQSAATVLKTHPHTIFLVVGFVRHELDYREQLENFARELGIFERVRIVSYAGDIGDLWQLIDVHAHPTLLDSLPNTIMEGMSLAKPAVVTSVGGIPSMVEHERTGLVVPPGDPVALATALERLLGDRHLAAKLGRAAFRRYLERYTAQTMTRTLEEHFAGIAACSGRREYG